MWTPDPAKIITAEQKAAEAMATLRTAFTAAIQRHLDTKANERHYDNIHTAIGYRDDPNEGFAAEAEALFVWRSAVWTFSTSELAKVLAAQRIRPSVEEFLIELDAACPFVWPMERAAMIGGKLPD
ncbi:hypothetical protein IB265_24725 [Ensifer sp. ENS10]|uniref:hypothetical protein n=1 Tax=Ensifer sp. ENS10 TaxID=2769286 RepID=UPI001786255F|nr:hypothetical protein [Ensifer sp. ENS10]MBD9509984.1 hypothetical protein [Ensifer sp. ENS10]